MGSALHRQQHLEGRTLADFAVHRDFLPVIFHDAARQRQARPGAATLVSVERAEDWATLRDWREPVSSSCVVIGPYLGDLALVLVPCGSQFVGGLQVHPEFRRRVEEHAETDGHIRTDSLLFQDNVADALRGDPDPLGQRITLQFERLKKFLFEDLSWV